MLNVEKTTVPLKLCGRIGDIYMNQGNSFKNQINPIHLTSQIGNQWFGHTTKKMFFYNSPSTRLLEIVIKWIDNDGGFLKTWNNEFNYDYFINHSKRVS